MKISDIVYKKVSEVDAMKRFDMNEPPRKQKWYLLPLAWLLSFPETWQRKTVIHKHHMKGLKGPYMLLCNHDAFFDFKVATRAIFPRRANYIVAIDGFIGREKLLRDVGCFCKRKFIKDIGLVKHIKHSLHVNKSICAIYPEARYSLVGTTAILPDSLGKMIKLLKVPVVTLICHGNHLSQPVWNLKKRKVSTSADMTQIITQDMIDKLSIDEINEITNKAFVYDDYRYQLDHQIHITAKDRAEGIHKVLYKCPNCGDEHHMNSKDHTIFCEACHKTYEMSTLGQLKATEGKTEFAHIPDWYEWERDQVKQEILAGKYDFEAEVDIDSLPNSQGYFRFGKGTLIHNSDGFKLRGNWGDESLSVDKTVLENYSVHIEFNYFGKGDGISFSLPNDTYYMFSKDRDYLVTKVHFAVEELYKLAVSASK